MAYVNQVDAHLAEARARLAHAATRAETWPECGKVLARAFEFAAAAVLISWGDPYKAGHKLHVPFLDRVAPLIDQHLGALVSAVWACEGRGAPVEDVATLLTGCEQVIGYLAGVAATDPPEGWEAPPVPTPIGWDSLSDDERAFLREALAHAGQWSPGVRIVLFGSRAAGRSGPGSDCDLLLIFPDDVAESLPGQAIAAVKALGIELGLEIDIEHVVVSEWDNPDEASVPFIERVKASGIEIRARRRPSTA